MKCCTRCNQELPLEAFSKNSRMKDGLAKWCRSCQKSYMDSYYEKNKQRLIERVAKWKSENPEKRKANTQRYYKRNKSYYHEKVHQRRSLQRAADHTSSDKEFVEQLYQYASMWNAFVPPRFKLHIDHIVPLKHELVCGLHTAANLQLLWAAENWSKNNSFERNICKNC